MVTLVVQDDVVYVRKRGSLNRLTADAFRRWILPSSHIDHRQPRLSQGCNGIVFQYCTFDTGRSLG